MIAEIIIRKASLKDLDMLFQFEQGVIAAERPFDVTLKTAQIYYYNIEEMLSSDHIELVVAETGIEIIGSGYARIENAKPYLKHQQHAYLGFMYTVPDHRGKGINKMIIQKLKEWSLNKGISELRLDVYCENIDAIHAYERAGFESHMLQMRMNIGHP